MPDEEPVFAPWHDYAESIESVVIKDGITGIGHFAFFDCVNLTSVSIPESVTFIGCAFIGCDSLQELYIPSSVTDFRYPTNEGICTGLTKITVAEENSVYSSDAYGMLYNKDKTTFIGAPTGYQGTYAIADSVTEIGGWAFTNCTGLTAVQLPAGLKTVGMSAFLGCTGLTELNIPDGVATLDATAFTECSGLTGITIPAGVTSLGQQAFANCTALEEVRFEGNAPDIDYECFYGTTITAYYPAEDETWPDVIAQRYAGTIEWVVYGEHVHELDENQRCECGAIGGICGENLTWILDPEGTMTISGTGDMTDYTDTNRPWYDYLSSITSVVIEDGVTALITWLIIHCSRN